MAPPPDRKHANAAGYRNTGAASDASVLSVPWQNRTDADDVALVGVGAGLTWGVVVVCFGEPARPNDRAVDARRPFQDAPT